MTIKELLDYLNKHKISPKEYDKVFLVYANKTDLTSLNSCTIRERNDEITLFLSSK